jgi:hypothetical protein
MGVANVTNPLFCAISFFQMKTDAGVGVHADVVLLILFVGADANKGCSY